MPQSSFQLEDLLPHRPPMILIDEVISFDEALSKIVAGVVIKKNWSESYVAIEFMAQTAAALVGALKRAKGDFSAARPGFLLGTRKLDLQIDRFEIGKKYLIHAAIVFSDESSASFECFIVEDGKDEIVASATLNAFCPENAADFID